MPISKPHSTLGSSNKGSCTRLALYLEKENKDLDKMLKPNATIEQIALIESKKQHFFSHSTTKISTNEVIHGIDTNIKKLGKKDAKYFAPTISFSQQELKHVIYLASGKSNINDVCDLSVEEFQKYNQLLMKFVRLIMTNYAKNFNRQIKGIKTGNDLVYFAKIEHLRHYKGTENEVDNKTIKSGDVKLGLQSHAHIIVSRKDKTQTIKLDPTTNERKTDRKIGGNSYRVGFDRVKWIETNEKTFDEFFKYKRKSLEQFKNQRILKNGSPKEKNELLIEIKKTEETEIINNPIYQNRNNTGKIIKSNIQKSLKL